MNYLVYKITNQTNGKIYIGVHKTSNVDDGYMGSGVMIKRAIKKYGLDSFSKEILAQFESADEMFEEEKNLISSLSPEYNLHPGGNGGWEYVNGNGFTNKGKDYTTVSQKLKGRKRPDLSESNKKRDNSSFLSAAKVSFTGKQHTKQTKEKIGKANSKHQTGSGNSNFGNRWITNGVKSCLIPKTDNIPDGWWPGRKLC